MSRAAKPKQFPSHGPELKALLAACHRDPDDDTPRLVLADWLQEHDDPRGELMRIQVRLAAMPAGDPEYDTLFEQHQKWWEKYGKLWDKEVGSHIWNAGPHDRGLPTLGHSGSDAIWGLSLYTWDLKDPAKHPKHSLSAAISIGWPGMVWVHTEEDEDGEIPVEILARTAFEPFNQPPWSGSPTPIGIRFTVGLPVTAGIIDRIAEIPNIRGLSLYDAQPAPDLLPQIAKIKRLEQLDLGGVELTDDDMRTLAPLNHLRRLIARDATITNEGADRLARFAELRELRLNTNRLTAPGFRSLAKLSKLEVLSIRKADDAAIRYLSGLERLRTLNLAGTKVTGRGIRNFPLLTHLSLWASQADNVGLAEVAALPRLRFLNVSETRITSKALQHLSGLRWLEDLFACETSIRDKDLVHLESLKRLRVVDLRKTRVTAARAAALQEKFPNATIARVWESFRPYVLDALGWC